MARVAKTGRPAAVSKPIPAPARAPHRRTPHRGWLLATTALLPIAAGPVAAQTLPSATTGPTGGQVTAGQAAITRGAGSTTITQGTNRAAIDWQQFNVGSQHTVQFVQPNAGSWTLNRVMTPDPSVIAGRVQANGGVAIVNQSGVVFAQGAQVNVASLIASAAGITNENFMAGRMVFDQAPRPGARVENHGTITVADRGLAALVAPGVSNSGVIRARLGRVALGAAETFVLDLAGDGLINIDVTQAVRTAPDGNQALVTNTGVIEAPGGSVLLTAHAASGLVEDLVRQTGVINVQTVGDQTGEVALRAQGGSVRVDGTIDATGGAGQRGGRVAVQATDGVTVAGTARIDASGGAGGGQVLVGTTGRGRNQTMAARTTVERGAVIRADATQNGNGGEIVVNSTTSTEMRGTVSARGGAMGGNGGFVEISGQQSLLISGFIDLAAPSGTPGELLLDPQNIIVSSNSNVNPPGGGSTVTDTATDPAANFTATTGNNNQWLRVDPGAITGFNGTVTLDAGNNIVVDSAINKTNGGLGLTAGDSITISANVSVSGALSLAATAGSISIGADLRAASMTMTAGTGINQTAGTIASVSGVGTALPLSATTAAGNISLAQAGNGSLALTFSAPGTVTVQSGDFANGQSGGTAGAIEIAGASSGGGVTLVSTRQNANAGTAGTGTIAVNASLTSTAGVTLNADGAITQNATGAIVTARDSTGILRIRNRTDGNATAAGSAALDQAANQIAVLDARTTGAFAVSSAGFAATGAPDNFPANPTMSVTLAEGGSVALTAPRLALPNGAVATGTDVTLVATETGGGAASAATLTIGGAVRTADEGTVRLRADRMDLTGATFDATGAGNNLALLEIGPQTAGRAIAWGGTDGTNLFLDTGSRTAIAGADATTVRLGQTTVNATAVTAGDIAFGSNLTIAGTLSLNGTGAISTAGGVLDVPTLVIRGATSNSGAASVALSGANVIDALDARATGDVSVTSSAPTFSILGASSGAGLVLAATAAAGVLDLGTGTVSAATSANLSAGSGGITQGGAGTLTAASLLANSTGNISLTGSGNAIGAIVNGITAPGGNGPLLTDANRGVYAGGTFTLATSGALSITGAVESRGGLVDITAGSVSIGAPIAVSGGVTPTLRLTTNGSGAASGNVSQTARVLTTASGALAVTATGSVDLSRTDNSIPTLLASSAGGPFSFTTTGGLTVSGAVSATDSLQLYAQGGTLAVNGALTTTNAGLIALTGTDITQAALIRPRGAAATSGGSVSLTATGVTGAIGQSTGGRIVADSLSLNANGGVNLTAGIGIGTTAGLGPGDAGNPALWNTIGSIVASTVGDFRLLNVGDLLFQGSAFNSAAGGTVAIVTRGRLTVGDFSSIIAEAISVGAGGGVTVNGVLGNAGLTTRLDMTTSPGGTIVQGAGGSVGTNTLRILAAGDVDLSGTGNTISNLAAAALAADVGINVRSNVGLTTVSAAAPNILTPDNTVTTGPIGIVSNDITLQAPSITIGAGAPLVRFDTNQVGSVTLITDNLINGGGEIDLGPGGTFGIGFDNPNIEILVGDPTIDTNIVAIPGASYVIAATPVTGALTQWISGTYINNLPLSAGTVNATLRIGTPGQTARTFVIGALTPNAKFTTFDIRGGDVVVGANVSAPGRTVNLAAGASILPSGTYARFETILTYDVLLNPIVSINVLNPAYLQANGVITAGTLIANAAGNVNLGGVAHNVASLSGSAGGTFSFRDADGFQIGPAGSGGISAPTRVVLQADTGSITQATGSPIDTAALEVNLPAGALVLDGGSANTTLAADLNRIDSLTQSVLSSFNANNGITIRNSGDLALNAWVVTDTAAGNVTLHSQSGNITQPSNLITTNTLSVSAPAGSVALTNGAVPPTTTSVVANELGAVGTVFVAGDFTLRTFLDMNLTGAVQVGTAAGGTSGAATLVSRFGSIVQQAGGSLAADSLTAVAPGGSVLLNGATTNSVGTVLASSAGTDFRLFTDRALTVAGTITGGAAGTVALRGDSDVTVNAALSGGSIAVQSGGDLATTATLTGGAGGAVTLAATGTVGIGANVSGGTISATGGGAMTVGANISGTSIELQGAGITLGSGGLGGTLTANRVLLRTGGNFDPASGTAGGPSIVQTAGTIETSQFSASAPGGDITLTATGNTFGTIVAGADAGGAAASAGIVAGGNVSLTTDGTLALNSPLLAGWDPARTGVTVTLRADQMTLGALVDTRGPGATNRQAGVIDIAPLTAANPVVLGGIVDIGAPYLTLEASELANLRAGTINVTTTNTGEGIYIIDTAALAGLMTGGTTLNLSAANGFVNQFAYATTTSQLTVERLNIAAGSFVTVGSASNLIGEVTGISAGGAISLASASPLLTLSGAVASAASGSTITIRADDLAITAGGSITVPSGTVDISGVTAGRGISLGTEVAGTLGLSTAEIGRIGQTTDPLALVRFGDTGSGTIQIQGNVSFRDAPADASSAVGGARALALQLTASSTGGDITQTGAGGLNVATISAVARSVSLTSAANAVDTVTALTGAGGGAALRSARDLVLPTGVTASAAGGALAVTSDGFLTVNGGAQATGVAGDVALTGRTGLAIASTAAVSAGGGIALTAGPAAGNGVGTLSINGTVSATGDIVASATGTLTVAQDIQSSAGNITLSTVAPGTQPAADIVITAPTVVGPNLGTSASVTEIIATGAGAGVVTLSATGSITQAASGTQIRANALQVVAGVNADLGPATNQVTELRSLSAGGAASLTVQNGLLVTGLASAVGSLTLNAGTTLTVAATGTTEATGPASVLSLNAGTAMTINGTASAETVNLTASGGQLAITGGTVTGGAGAGGSVTLAGTSLAITGGADVTAQTITANLASGNITLDSSNVAAQGAAGVLSLATTGVVSVTGGTVGGNTATLDAGAGGLTVTNAALTAGSGGFTLTSDGATLLSGGTTTVTGGTLQVLGQTSARINGGTHNASGGVAVNATAGLADILSATVGSTGGDVTVSGTAATISGGQVNAGGLVGLTASTGNAVVSGATVGAGTDITLTATAGQATVTNGALTAGGDIQLQADTLAQISGGTHRATGNVDLTATGGAANLTGTANVTATNGEVALIGTSASITGGIVRAGTDIALTGTSGQTLVDTADLGAGRDIILQSPGGAYIAGGVAVAGRNVTLTGPGNYAYIYNGADVTATSGAVDLSGAYAIIDSSTIRAGTDVTLAGTSQAYIYAGTTNAGGNISVDGATFAALYLGTHTAGAGVNVTAAAGDAYLYFTNATANGGNIALAGLTTTIDTSTAGASGNVTMNGGSALVSASTITAGGDLAMTATAGAATITNGTTDVTGAITLQGATQAQISGGTHTAGTGVSLTSSGGAANVIGTAVAANGGDVTLSGTSATIDTTTVGASGTISLTGTTGSAIVSAGGLTAGDSISVQGRTLARITGGTHVAAQDVTIASAAGPAETLNTTVTATAGTLSMTGTAATMSGATLRAGTAIAMTATGGAVSTTNGSLTSGGDITLAASGTATLAGTVTNATGATSITGQAGATLSGGSHAGGQGFALAAPGGTATLSGTTITSGTGGAVSVTGAAVVVNGGQVASGGSLALSATAGDLNLGAPVLSAATTLGLNATGTVLVQPGTSAAAGTDLTVNAGTLTVTSASLSAGQDMLMTVGGGASFSGASLFATRDIRLGAGGLVSVNGGKFDGGNEIALSGGSFNFTSANIDPQVIRITAVNNISIVNSTMTASDAIRILAGGSMTVTDSTFTAVTLGIESGGPLTLERGLYIIGDAVVFASPTSIQTVGRIVVRPLGTDLPGVAFDTRITVPAIDPLDIIQPDNPNLPASQQPTQVREPGTDAPGDFGVPTGNPAGTLNFTIDAGRSAIFLLIDGGSATGDINTAGRVGIFGTGGTVTLRGTLIDYQGNQYSGGNASALTDSARPAPGDALARFTFNDCVISSINCFVPQQVLAIPQAPPQQVDIRLFGSRITDPDVQIPNVAEEDY
ncbi:two-partner secretion domain-containing protein [Neoroseomonas oryzicola]|uniref:Filamentous hemagglutinin N-terminal domain-containing protein n=1 Tax=Neoroseomonas oryzicola TaxID=535904 RepID=A0A9X9WEI0_9PROT|nr:filamentous hemagglutinin N-terminal domain-containing protein [Neoroseomonas oryzicola]MBR0658740.1 filamentous hemagglutinin N-terminal domain-containing protein [Neoroseomonas oryzicola]NKE17218.1 filamentous hemagglutinin N-terminal domain-containing protein [Neoroseomonas oryzicola]